MRPGQAGSSSAFDFSHFAAHLGGAPRIATPPGFDSEWDRARQSSTPQRVQHSMATPQDWATSFEGKGKGRALASPPPPPMAMQAAPHQLGGMPYQSMHSFGGFQPALQPMYQNYMAQPPPVVQQMAGPSMQEQAQREQEDMNAAFERALADAKAKDAEDLAAEQQQQAESQTQEYPEEEVREVKGDFEKVWESLRPEAERLNKLAEWEKDFSQVRPRLCSTFHPLAQSGI